VTNININTTLLHYRIFYDRKKFYDTDSWTSYASQTQEFKFKVLDLSTTHCRKW